MCSLNYINATRKQNVNSRVFRTSFAFAFKVENIFSNPDMNI